MSIKITRCEAEKKLKDMLVDIPQTILDLNVVEPIKFYTVNRYVDVGMAIREYYCQNCGHTHKEEDANSRYYYNPTRTCPDCGNSKQLSGTSYHGMTEHLFIQENDNDFIYVLFRCNQTYPNDNDWYKKDPTISISISYIGMYDSTNGWFTYDNNRDKLLKRACYDEKRVFNDLFRLTPINSIKTPWSDLRKEMLDFQSKIEIEKTKRKATSKTIILEEMRQKFKGKSVDESKIVNVQHTVLYDLYSEKENESVISAYCTKCGHEFQYVYENDKKAECPCCGTVTKERSYSWYSKQSRTQLATVAIFENTNLPEQDLLIRVFKVRRQYSIQEGYSEVVWEQQRIFAGKKVNVYDIGYVDSLDKDDIKKRCLEKCTIREITNDLVPKRWANERVAHVVQDEEIICEIIRNSCLKYSGMVEAYGLGDERYKPYKALPDLNYMMTWYKKPSIELVLKANLTNLVEDFVRDPDKFGIGTTLTDVLMVSPQVIKCAVKANFNSDDLSRFTALYNADNSITVELYNEIRSHNLTPQHFSDLKTNHGIDYAQALKYLQTAYDHQCIEKREALNIWLDYLRMAKALKIDLTDKSRKYPSSLKKEHDVAMFAYRSVQAEIDKEQFAEQAKKNAYYEYTYKDLMVIVPKTPEEIVEEATRQKNCLRSYIERIKNGETVVVFIRRKETPEFTYVTAEVNHGTLNQLKGYCNSNPRNKELNEFVAHWAKAKGIRVSC